MEKDIQEKVKIIEEDKQLNSSFGLSPGREKKKKMLLIKSIFIIFYNCYYNYIFKIIFR